MYLLIFPQILCAIISLNLYESTKIGSGSNVPGAYSFFIKVCIPATTAINWKYWTNICRKKRPLLVNCKGVLFLQNNVKQKSHNGKYYGIK